jgi:hypothetical protein
MLKRFLAAAVVVLSVFGATAVHAQGEPTVDQVYEAANSGHLDRAQSMIQQVLRGHPESAKAHYVAAELDARQGRIAEAREELAAAERLKPGLPFARPESVHALRAQLGTAEPPTAGSSTAARFPLGPVILGVLILALVIWALRRRSAAAAAPYRAPYPGSSAPPAAGYGPPPPSGGVGSGIASGLATGLGVGAGIVAGEALADRLLHGGSHEREALPPGTVPERYNDDLGGKDFGISDGGSWDDGGGGFSDDSGGGGDWT